MVANMWEGDKMKKEIEIHKGVGLDLETSIFVKKQLFNNKNDNR